MTTCPAIGITGKISVKLTVFFSLSINDGNVQNFFIKDIKVCACIENWFNFFILLDQVFTEVNGVTTIAIYSIFVLSTTGIYRHTDL